MAQKEIYRLDIKIGVDGDTEAKKKLTATEKFAKQSEKKLKTLDKIKASPSVTLKDKLSKPLDKVESKMTRFSKNMDKISNKCETAGNNLSKTGKNMTRKVTAPIVAVGTIATKVAMDFGKGMAKVNTIANLGKDELNLLSKATLNLSNDTGVAAKDLSEMEYNALSASVAVKDLTSVVKTSSQLSKGGFADANDSLKLLTSTYNVYREQFEKMGVSQAKASEMIADKMITVQNLGVTTVGQLSTQLGNITPLANNANLSLDELAASMIVLTKNGLGTSESVTGLKATLSNIIKPSEQAIKMADALGLEFNTTAIRTKGFGGFLKDIREKLKGTNPALIKAADNMSKYQHMIDGATEEQKKNKTQMREWQGRLTSAKDQLQVLTKSGGETTGALAQLFGSVEGLGAVLSLTSEYGMKDFQNGLEASKNSIGSTQKAAETMAKTPAEKFEKAMNKMKNAGIQLGLKLMPLAEKGMDLISKLADKITALSPGTQEFILKTLIATATIGPFMGAIGGTLKGVEGLLKTGKSVGTFFGLFKGATAAAEAVGGIGVASATATGVATGGGIAGLTASLAPFLVAAAPWIAGAVAVGVAGYGIYKVLNKKTIPEVDLFADKIEYTSDSVGNAYRGMSSQVQTNTIKISDATKKALGAYMDLDEKASKALLSLKFNSGKITKENAENITSTFDTMAQQIISSIDSKYQKQYDTATKFFNSSSALTDKEEQKIVAKMNAHTEFEKQIVKDGNTKINEILQGAATKNREITNEEYTQINNIRENMQRSAVETMTQSEVEQRVILERLKQSAGDITANQAADVIKNSAKARDGRITDANKTYSETLAWVIRERDETHTISNEEADKIIAAAQRKRDIAVGKAQEMHAEVVRHASEQCAEHISKIDTETGEIKTVWQRAVDWFKENPLTQYFKKKNEDAADDMRIIQNSRILDPVEYSPHKMRPAKYDGYASGTNSATQGIHEVAENGFEIVMGRQFRMFNGREKVLNHGKSKNILNSQSNTENEAPKSKFAIAKPTLAGVGGGNVNIDVNVENTFDSDSDVDKIVQEAMQEFGYKLKEAIKNVKK